jgi:hypothetical protein
MKGGTSLSNQLKLIERVARAMSALPSLDERDRIVRLIDESIDRLGRLRAVLQSLPDSGQSHQVSAAAETVVAYLTDIRSQPEILVLLGLKLAGSRPPGSKPRPDIMKAAERLKADLKDLEMSQIYSRLSDYKLVTMEELRALGKLVGVPGAARLSRQDLVDKVAKRGFALPRGYDLLGPRKQC